MLRPGGDERNQASWLVSLEFPLLAPTSGKAWGTFLLLGTTRCASLLIRKETKKEYTAQRKQAFYFRQLEWVSVACNLQSLRSPKKISRV